MKYKVSTIFGWLHRNSYRSGRQGVRGFTIVELLIVIVIIAILAAITIVAYNGIQTRAYKSAVQSDYSNTVKTTEAYYYDPALSTSTYPFSATTITQAGVKLTKANYTAAVWCYSSAHDAWALVADTRDGGTYYVSNTQRTMTTFTANKVQGTSGGVTCPVLGMPSWLWLVQCAGCVWAI